MWLVDRFLPSFLPSRVFFPGSWVLVPRREGEGGLGWGGLPWGLVIAVMWHSPAYTHTHTRTHTRARGLPRGCVCSASCVAEFCGKRTLHLDHGPRAGRVYICVHASLLLMLSCRCY